MLEAAGQPLRALAGEEERQGEQQEEDDGQNVAAVRDRNGNDRPTAPATVETTTATASAIARRA